MECGAMPESRKAAWGEALAWAETVAQTESDGCVMWPFLSANGQTLRPVMGQPARPVTHVVLELAGRPVPDGLQANHTCDESWCCNPRHLYAGTQAQNIRDAIRRGRMRGLPDETVAEIRRLSGAMSYRGIAKHLGVTFDAARYHARRARQAA